MHHALMALMLWLDGMMMMMSMHHAVSGALNTV
jgi:hypothetical protein